MISNIHKIEQQAFTTIVAGHILHGDTNIDKYT